MKHCKMCARVLPLSEFSVRSRQTPNPCAYCRDCQRQYSREHYLANKLKHNQRRYINQKRYAELNRRKLWEFLDGKYCADCGERDILVLDFDHVQGIKEFNIGNAISRLSWHRIEREITKCEIRCANCHRRKTAREFQWFKYGYGA